MSTSTILWLCNHQPTEAQIEELCHLGYDEVEQLNPELAEVWKNIPPEEDGIGVYTHLKPIIDILVRYNAVMLAGELTASIYMARRCQVHFLKVYTATSERVSVDVPQPDGSTKKVATFRHCRFRKI